MVLSGERDLRTPPPIAAEAADRLPDEVLVTIPEHGHSALDTRPTLLLEAISALADGAHLQLPRRIPQLLATSRAGTGRVLPALIRATLAADRLRSPLPRRPPRRPREKRQPASAPTL